MRVKKREFGQPHETVSLILAALFILISVFDSSASREKISMNSGWKFIQGNPSAGFEHVLMDETGTTQGANNWYHGYSSVNTGARTGLMTFDTEWYNYDSRWCYPANNGSCYIADRRHISSGTGPDPFSMETACNNGLIPRIEWVSPHADNSSLQITFSTMFDQAGQRARILHNGMLVWEGNTQDAWKVRSRSITLPSVNNGDTITFMASSYSAGCRLSWHYLTITDNAADLNEPGIPGYADVSWAGVMLPYEPLSDSAFVSWPALHYQGIMWYRKNFQLDASYQGRKLYLEFESATVTTDVWVNGTKMTTHYGGFLPFMIDITDVVFTDGTENVLAVKVSGLDDPDVPSYANYAGINGDVWLHATDKLHITDAVFAEKEAGGGLFVSYSSVSTNSATVQIKTHVTNEYDSAKTCSVETHIYDADNMRVAFMSGAQSLVAAAEHTFDQSTSIPNPKLWHPDSPHLYTVVTKVLDGNQVVDIQTTRIGIRSIFFSKAEGFKINGQSLRWRGSNSNLGYPYIGTAVSDEAIYRDVRRLKEMGFNYLRPSPEARPCNPAYMDACDELGLLVLDPIFCNEWNDTTLYKNRCYQMMRDLIRRDRNHACVVAWELSLNEKWWTAPEFSPTAMAIGHAEYPGDQCYVAAWKDGGKYGETAVFDIHISTPSANGRTYTGPLPLIISEHGHWEYINAGADSDSDCVRGDGEIPMLSQAFNHMESHNLNRALANMVGDGVFTAVDYLAYDSGIMDFFRLPKFSYYFWQSQRDPSLVLSGVDSGPMVKIVHYWTSASPADVTIFSNCEQVKLYRNGSLLATQTPDTGPGTANISEPPFTFSAVAFAAGELKAEGYIGGQLVVTDIVKTPGSANKLDVTTSAAELVAEGDVCFVYVKVRDLSDEVVTSASNLITLEITSGPAEIIGPSQISAEAGIAGFLIRTDGNPGAIQIRASSSGLQQGTAQLDSVVAGVNVSPSFASSRIAGLGANQDEPYGGTLAGSATDPDIWDTLTYTNTTGPAWLSVAPDGLLSGTPSVADLGTNTFTVQVFDGKGGTDSSFLSVIVKATPTNPAAIPVDRDQPYPQWLIDSYQRIDNAVAAAQLDQVKVVFFGDSITHQWLTTASGLWNSCFNVQGDPYYSINLGISGDCTEHLLHRILSAADGGRGDFDDPALAPDVIVLKIGVNNTFTGQSNAQISDGIHEVVTKLLIKEPQAKILLLSILPSSDNTRTTTQINPINTIISAFPTESAFAGKVSYFDLHSYYLSGGVQDTQYFVDALHLNTSGYTVWKDAMLPVLTTLLGLGNAAPSFTSDPFSAAAATEGFAYNGTIAGSATDPNSGDILTYSKVGATPAWITVAANGVLSGTPTSADTGLNSIGVQVSDGNGGTDTANLQITVQASGGGITEYIVGVEDWIVTWSGAAKIQSPTLETDAGVLSGSVLVSSEWWEGYYWISGGPHVYYGCVDGTFGGNSSFTANTQQAAAGSALSSKAPTAHIDFTVTAGTTAVQLDTFHFDAYRQWSGNTSGYTLSILSGGGLAAQTIMDGSGAFFVLGGLNTTPGVLANANYQDFDIALSGIAGGNTLAAGQSVTFRLAYDEIPGGGYNQGLLDNMAVIGTVSSESNLFESWMGDYGLDPANAMVDSDGDGQENLVEYALGGNPTNGMVMGRPVSIQGLDGSGMDYIYPRYKDYAARNLSYQVEASSNLISAVWSTNGVATTGVAGLDADFEAVTNRIPSADEQLFIRLRIELTE